MKYTVYKIINLINGKIYIGVHKTNNLDDNYMGSGVNIKRAIKKYGIQNFKKEYIAIFNSADEMFDLEFMLVNEDFVKSGNTYNIVTGGNGGFDYVNNVYWTTDKHTEHGKKFGSIAGSWCDIVKRRKVWESVSLEFRKENAKKMGKEFGGLNKLTKEDIANRLEKIKDIDLTKFGWVQKVATKLNITHTQTRRFIEKYYCGEYFRRKK
jgi:hypothetical protein